MSLECRYGHRTLVSIKELISRLSPTATIYEVARKAKCSHCQTKGVQVILGCIMFVGRKRKFVYTFFLVRTLHHSQLALISL
jgi:hypothetical protein